MNAERILQVIIGIAMVAGVIFMIRCYTHSQKVEKERLKQGVVDRLGEVDIDPRATFGELRQAFGTEPEMKLSGTNAVEATYGSDYGIPLVQFIFFEPDNKIESVTDKDIPVRIYVEHPFRGSICGVHTQDPVEAAEANIRRCFGMVRRKSQQNEGWALVLEESFTLSRYQTVNRNSLSFSNNAYETKVQVVPNFGSSESK